MHVIKKIFPQPIKNIYHLFQAIIANFWYGFPSRKIKVIGVTGTNGKTTTVQMIAKIFEEAGKKVAVASTINFKIDDEEWTNKTKYTTMSSFSVQKFVKKAVDAGCEYLVLETSSHSLDQHRVWGVEYKTAVITNITREHLDYHKTIEKYRSSKKKLFEIAAKHNGTIIVNLDMERPEEFLEFKNCKIFGYTAQDKKNQEVKDILRAEEIELEAHFSKFKIQNLPAGRQGSKYLLNMPGKYNIENALAAICVGISEEIDLEICSKALEKIKGVPGRMEIVPNSKGLNIIIDYAVTPDSLEKLYELIVKTKKENAKIIAVFGSCGERDRGKRPIMGEIVSRHADFVILTNEDPYFEDPAFIIEEISRGIKNKKENENFWKILDRRKAISKALSLANEGDIVVVTGKGAEETMAIGNKRIPWSDKEVILEELKN